MATQQTGAVTLGRPRSASLWRPISNFVTRKPLGAFGAIIIVLMALMAVVGPQMTSWDPLEWNLTDKLLGPTADHWLGTDEMGRDLWSRMMSGARISLLVGFASVAFGSGAGRDRRDQRLVRRQG